jgi:hypothetical protein
MSGNWEDGLADAWESWREEALTLKRLLEDAATSADVLFETLEEHLGDVECGICSFLETEFNEVSPTVMEIAIAQNPSADDSCFELILEGAKLMPEYYQSVLADIVVHPNASDETKELAQELQDA